jgi:hypothetical protein
MTNDPILVSINNAGAFIGRCRRTIYGLIAADQISAVKSGRSTLIVFESLKRYAASLPAAKFKLDDRAKRHVDSATA